MVIKVLNGCGINNAYWVFAGGLTNVRVTMTVTDMSNATVKTYVNTLNTPFAPIQDTGRFRHVPLNRGFRVSRFGFRVGVEPRSSKRKL